MQRFLVIVQLDAQIPFNIFIYSSLLEAVLIQSVSPDDEHDMLETCSEL